jgi:hypothetical protein
VSGLHFGPLLIPFYQSWESGHKIPDNSEWVLDRIRFDVSLPLRINF